MSLVQIARYADLREAQVAASMLRARGMLVVLPEEQMIHTNFLLSQALGGCRLCVSDEDAEEALALIAPHRVGDKTALDWRGHPDAVSSAPAALFWAVADPQSGGYAWANLKRRFSLMSLIVTLLSLATLAALVALPWLAG